MTSALGRRLEKTGYSSDPDGDAVPKISVPSSQSTGIPTSLFSNIPQTIMSVIVAGIIFVSVVAVVGTGTIGAWVAWVAPNLPKLIPSSTSPSTPTVSQILLDSAGYCFPTNSTVPTCSNSTIVNQYVIQDSSSLNETIDQRLQKYNRDVISITYTTKEEFNGLKENTSAIDTGLNNLKRNVSQIEQDYVKKAELGQYFSSSLNETIDEKIQKNNRDVISETYTTKQEFNALKENTSAIDTGLNNLKTNVSQIEQDYVKKAELGQYFSSSLNETIDEKIQKNNRDVISETYTTKQEFNALKENTSAIDTGLNNLKTNVSQIEQDDVKRSELIDLQTLEKENNVTQGILIETLRSDTALLKQQFSTFNQTIVTSSNYTLPQDIKVATVNATDAIYTPMINPDGRHTEIGGPVIINSDKIACRNLNNDRCVFDSNVETPWLMKADELAVKKLVPWTGGLDIQVFAPLVSDSKIETTGNMKADGNINVGGTTFTPNINFFGEACTFGAFNPDPSAVIVTVNGKILATAYNTPSSREVKRNIVEVNPSSLHQNFMDYIGRIYEYNYDPAFSSDTTKQIGGIAENYYAADPRLTHNSTFIDRFTNATRPVMAVQTNRILTYTAAETRYAHLRLDEHQDRIIALGNKTADCTLKTAQLEAALVDSQAIIDHLNSTVTALDEQVKILIAWKNSIQGNQNA
jgi:hypothetical protein